MWVTQNLRTGYKILNKGDQAAAVLLDLSKSFHCIDYNPLPIKAKPTCSRKNYIDFMYSHYRKKKTTVNYPYNFYNNQHKDI